MSNPIRAKALVYTVALFFAGGVCGVMVAPRLFPPPPPAQPLKLGRVDEIRQKIQDKLEQRLKLTPDEIAKAGPWIAATSQKLEDAHLKCLTQVDQIIGEFHQSLKPLLTEDQNSTLKDLDKERADTMAQKYNYHPAVTNATGRN